MSYSTIKELPDQVRDNLPKHAQEIYKEAFNSAWKEYEHDESRAHRIAWSAVKKEYKKADESGEWTRKDN